MKQTAIFILAGVLLANVAFLAFVPALEKIALSDGMYAVFDEFEKLDRSLPATSPSNDLRLINENQARQMLLAMYRKRGHIASVAWYLHLTSAVSIGIAIMLLRSSSKRANRSSSPSPP